jgi:hypothetical protein
MAGGYTGGKMSRARLVDLHRLTINCAALLKYEIRCSNLIQHST